MCQGPSLHLFCSLRDAVSSFQAISLQTIKHHLWSFETMSSSCYQYDSCAPHCVARMEIKSCLTMSGMLVKTSSCEVLQPHWIPESLCHVHQCVTKRIATPLLSLMFVSRCPGSVLLAQPRDKSDRREPCRRIELEETGFRIPREPGALQIAGGSDEMRSIYIF